MKDIRYEILEENFDNFCEFALNNWADVYSDSVGMHKQKAVTLLSSYPVFNSKFLFNYTKQHDCLVVCVFKNNKIVAGAVLDVSLNNFLFIGVDKNCSNYRQLLALLLNKLLYAKNINIDKTFYVNVPLGVCYLIKQCGFEQIGKPVMVDQVAFVMLKFNLDESGIEDCL